MVELKLDEKNLVKYILPYTWKNEKLTYKNIICVCEIKENDPNDTPAFDTTLCDDDTQKAEYNVGRKSGKRYLVRHIKRDKLT